MTQIVMITGGSRGLGKNSALTLAEHGFDVVITYQKNKEAAEEVVSRIKEKGQKAAALQLDVGNSGEFNAFSQQFKTLLKNVFHSEYFDVLVNNAGAGIHVPFEDTTEAQFDLLMNTHLKGTFFLTQTLLPLLKQGGRIINTSSGLARFSLPGYAAYAMMKGGVEVLTRYLAKELGDRQINVNTLAPGAIETDFAGGAVRDNAQINQFIASQTALGRVGLPDDIGQAVAMLASKESRWVTGQRIEASGGMFL